jgi:hypothetical protein
VAISLTAIAICRYTDPSLVQLGIPLQLPRIQRAGGKPTPVRWPNEVPFSEGLTPRTQISLEE